MTSIYISSAIELGGRDGKWEKGGRKRRKRKEKKIRKEITDENEIKRKKQKTPLVLTPGFDADKIKKEDHYNI